MKVSKALIPTLRQAPNDAEVISHKLLVRAGMIRKVAAGIYELLPLGLRSLRKVEAIVRQELDMVGCQEVDLPHLVPSELWQESGRWRKYGKELLRLKDRHEREYCFGPTHEETICDLVRATVNSYKSLPLNLYQIQTKFRDETRPRYGLMRGREFLMKDAYSFHDSFEDLDREYAVMHQAYLNIFKHAGLQCRAVDADTGSIGGSSSHEFMVLAETGEDAIAVCGQCQYAANIEKAKFKLKVVSGGAPQAMEEVSTPDLKTIEEVSGFLKINPDQMIKTLCFAHEEGFAIVCLPGDRELNQAKLAGLLGAGEELRLASDDEVMSLTGVPTGFLGPINLNVNVPKDKKGQALRFDFIFDAALQQNDVFATGANKKDFHFKNVSLTRDFGDKWKQQMADVSTVRAGDACPDCDAGSLQLMKGIEVGHIFKLGQRYSEPMKVNYLDQNGKDQHVVMGTYGIGIGRTMAASVEQNHDDKGIIWPAAIAPYHVHLLMLDDDDEIQSHAQNLYNELWEHGIEVLWDDRKDRAGVKFNDADLIGLPLQVVMGNRGLKNGAFEMKIRKSGEKKTLPLDNMLNTIREELKNL
ncbi:MAG: proline--tRNA ligase [Deltaproteobacteria bacterium]|nr:proline--tRNA ligase [Deltaproteobacteria bacterium]